MAWLNPISLQGDILALHPLHAKHEAELIDAARDGALWNLRVTSIPSPDTAAAYIQQALQQQALGQSLPFVVYEKASGRLLGSTRYCHIEAAHRHVEIGHTWYRQSVQRSAVNSECKFLLLRHAFEHANAIAVEFRTNSHNHKSRAAITRLGAHQDGILRQHQLMPDGSYRDTVCYSILNSEWPAIKNALLQAQQRYLHEQI